MFYSYNGLRKYYYDLEDGELVGKYFAGEVVNEDETPIFISDQFIEFMSLDKSLSYDYQEIMEISDEMFDNMFNNYSKNFKLDNNSFDIFEICNVSTGEEFSIIGIKIEGNKIFNLEKFKVEDYDKCIVNKVDRITLHTANTRDAFLKKFYEKYYPDKLEELEKQDMSNKKTH